MARQKDKKQTIELTKKQFTALLKVVYLGNWMANAYRDDSPEDPHIQEYEEIEDYIFSLASQFGLEKYVDHEVTDGDRYYPTNFFEETTDVHKLHEEYDEETFWDELADRLSTRDFLEKYSKEEINNMSREEYFEKISEFTDKYNEEFEKFGLDRIKVINEKN